MIAEGALLINFAARQQGVPTESLELRRAFILAYAEAQCEEYSDAHGRLSRVVYQLKYQGGNPRMRKPPSRRYAECGRIARHRSWLAICKLRLVTKLAGVCGWEGQRRW